MKRFKLINYIIVLLFLPTIGNAQLVTIATKKKYNEAIRTNNNCRLVDLNTIKQNGYLALDLRYATIHNFTHTNLYKKATTTYMLVNAANALAKVLAHLKIQGYGLKIFDAYRPYSATKLMWELIKDERYVANPAQGSNHNRGLSIDLTLTNTNGTELNMGTAFDNFTDTAHHSFKQLPQEVLNNRLLLKTTMEKFGFKALDTEWWHYTFITNEKFAIFNLPFKLLKKIVK